MFKLQYRIYPDHITSEGAIRYIVQYRRFPFWWTHFVDNNNCYITSYYKENALNKLKEILKDKEKLRAAQREAKPL